jgi:two-component system cell cycle sensor histidine kinase/response regulator CckA
MSAQPDLPGLPARILIVDDERHNRELLEVMLTPQGFTLQMAGSGEEALAIVAQQPPDLILLDVMMPGMDGYEVAVSVKSREATENIPVIMVTALDDRASKLRGLHAGAEDFLTKPVDRLELSVRVRNLLRLKAYGDFYGEYSQRLEGEVSSRTADLVERTNTLEQQADVLNEQAALLDLAQDAIVVCDMPGRIVFWSRGAEVMYGFRSADALGRTMDDLLKTEGAEPIAAIEAALLRQGQWKGEAIHYTRDGTRLIVDSHCALQCDAHHAPVRVLTIVSDITESRQAAADLLELTQREQSRQEQMRFKDEFLSHVSHELRSPLTAIKQFTSILLSGHAGELNLEQREYEEIVLKNIRQLQSMIDDLLEVTRLETGKLNVRLDRVHIADAVTDTLDTLQITAGAKGVALTCDLTPGLRAAHADRTRLRQILIILVDNAVKFTPAGGTVCIQARPLPGDPQFLLVEVADTGCGISPEIRERIFERLYQLAESAEGSRKGLGLGLYICKELVTRQGGQIWVGDRPENGSVFSFTLPVFSLGNLMAPLLKDGRWPTDSAALITIESSVADAWPSIESREEWSTNARDLVERCLLPDQDVLLPSIVVDARVERFYVAAFANDLGVSILASRIQEQFARSPHVNRAGLTLSVSHSVLDPFSIDHLSLRLGGCAT